jgi:hypothetical protein
MEAALACLVRLDAGRDSNAAEVAKVAADVELLLGAHKGACEELVRDGLNTSLARMEAMQKVLVQNANSNTAMLAGKVDQQGGLIVSEIAELRKEISEMALAQKNEKKDLEKVQIGVQGSKDSFEDLFELAPCTVEAYVQMHGEDAADTGEEERSELGEGAFGTTYRMRARMRAKLVGVKPGQLFAVKKVASFDRLNLDLLSDFSSEPSQTLSR